ncbi:hypothetical protein [Costertonia aggregata]|uniref:Uncharacterized protein n=1 Tax=Costertonia aggregata TaxID=343403 RepID=A0A7H9ANV1_9FLAO|nr:hypothetical protein [Costertonia aggregata]QLG45116.1 hypothetical protein HYG79_07050 [Costertonia aggregata]
MKLYNIKIVFVLILTLLIWSCQNEIQNEEIIDNNQSEFANGTSIQEDEFLKNVTLLLGKAMTNTKVQEEMLSSMRNVDRYGELVSLSYMLGNEKTISKSEKTFLEKNVVASFRDNSTLKEVLKNELDRSNDAYFAIYEKYNIPDNVARKGETNSKKTADDLLELLANEELHLYYPYDVGEKTDKSFKSEELFLTYSPVEYTETNEVYRVINSNTGRGPELQSVGYQNDDYLYENKVLVIGYMDDCDIPGRPCDFAEVFPIPIGDDDLPPPYNGGPKLLPYNVNPASIKEEDILSTRMMQFGTKNSGWGGFGRTHLKLEVKRGSLDGNPTVVDGKIFSGARVFNFFKTKYRMKGDKRGWWHDYKAVFDEDWNMTEAEQMIAIFTNHHLKASQEAELTAKVGAEIKDGKIVPKVEGSISYKVKVKVGASKFRTKFPISRKLALVSIVGSNDLYPETRFYKGRYWNKKTSPNEKFFYFFNHFYTKLH